MKTLSEISKQLQSAQSSTEFADLIRSTSSYAKQIALLQAKAANARQMAAVERTAYEVCCNIWDRDAQARGEKGFGIPVNFEKKIRSIYEQFHAL